MVACTGLTQSSQRLVAFVNRDTWQELHYRRSAARVFFLLHPSVSALSFHQDIGFVTAVAGYFGEMLGLLLIIPFLAQCIFGIPMPDNAYDFKGLQSQDGMGDGPITVARYDCIKPGSYERDRILFNSVEIPGTTSGKVRVAVQKAAPQPFQFTFSCSDVSPEICKQAEAGFERAGQLIAKSMQIVTTINVQVTFRSFCNSAKKGQPCTMNNTLGQASAAAYFAAKTEDASDWAFYPQALVKQLPRDHVLEFNPYDIIAEFNTDYSFYFRTSNRPILPTESDFEFVVCHELTHGLGFDTAWASYFSVYQGLTQDSSYLAPLVYTPANKDRAELKKLAKIISSYPKVNVPLQNFISGFQLSGTPYNAAREVFSTVTAGTRSIYFKPKGNSKPVFLQTKQDVFQPGSSISHVDYEQYWSTADFLMIPAVQNLTGYTLDDIINANTRSSGLNGGIYGPGTQSIMEAIGWPLTSEAQVQRIIINPSPETYRSSCKSLRNLELGPATILAVLVFTVGLYM
ncbi:hypothetical protein BASA50_010347 [Batrachochytrium salamandrivorans]|uniref:Uncharacterized protein n=1 Tax=Batrachochytrium salamandrivorans TaxID=1357716 RepID=A0ABQ8F1V1_9FUNG|nr:hypothetical protein BASA50_010347 [Batrachochytrium salamandrivorans]